jgi:hypothetical protein
MLPNSQTTSSSMTLRFLPMTRRYSGSMSTKPLAYTRFDCGRYATTPGAPWVTRGTIRVLLVAGRLVQSMKEITSTSASGDLTHPPRSSTCAPTENWKRKCASSVDLSGCTRGMSLSPASPFPHFFERDMVAKLRPVQLNQLESKLIVQNVLQFRRVVAGL